jgi:hypothetical protein
MWQLQSHETWIVATIPVPRTFVPHRGLDNGPWLGHHSRQTGSRGGWGIGSAAAAAPISHIRPPPDQSSTTMTTPSSSRNRSAGPRCPYIVRHRRPRSCRRPSRLRPNSSQHRAPPTVVSASPRPPSASSPFSPSRWSFP